MMTLLMKHEIRQTYRPIATGFGAVVLLTATAAGLVALHYSAISVAGMVVGMIALVALPLGLIGFFWWRYYQTMYGKQGYLTMTLPVQGRQIFWAKVLWAYLVIVAGYAVTVTGWLTLASIWQRQSIPALIREGTPPGRGSLLTGMALMIAILLAVTVITGAFAITVGSESRFWRLGLGGPVLVTFLTYMAYQVVVLVSMLFLPFGLEIGSAGVKIVFEPMLSTLVESVRIDGTPDPAVVGLGLIPALVVLAGVAAWWSIRSISSKTSLR